VAEEVCLSIRFAPQVVDKLASIVYSDRADRRAQMRELLRDALEFVRRLGLTVTTTGAATMCVRGTASQFSRAFDTAPPVGGWSARGFQVVDQRALDAIARKLPGVIKDIAVQRSFHETAVGIWPPPPPGAGCLGLLEQVPKLLGADRAHAMAVDGAGVRVMVFDSDFAFDHRYFQERQANFKELLAVPARPLGEGDPPPLEADDPPSGHGTAMAALVLAVAPRAQIIGMRLRNNVLLEGIDTALALSPNERPHIFSISLTRDMCDRVKDDPSRGTCWTELPRDLEHIADELSVAVARGITVVTGSGNGDYGFPAAMKQVVAVGGAQVDPDHEESRAMWEGGSAFKSKITVGDCKDRFVPDVCGLAGKERGAYIVLPVPPDSSFERDFPVAQDGPAGSGWALFSGTSAATAQVAGVCALVLQQRPGLGPRQVKNLLRRTARDVIDGRASKLSDLPDGEGLLAAVGPEDADGFGLVDAFEAVKRADDPAATDTAPER